jgi:hypothetical protein
MSLLQVGLLALLAGAFSRPLHGDFSHREWQFSKSIERPDGLSSGYCRFSLDAETFDGSQPSLADLRIVSDQGKEVPYTLHEEREKTTEEVYSPRMFNRSVLPGKYSTLTLDLEREAYNNTLTLKIKAENFRRRVEIAGSQDAKQWFVLKDDAYIFDFTGDKKVQLTTVRYPENKYRYLLVKVWNGTDPPLEIDGASLSQVTTTTPQRVNRASTLLSREEDRKLKTSQWVLDLKYRHLPSDFLRIDTPEENFSRRAEILGSNDLKTWNRLAQFDLYRFHTTRYSVEKRTQHFPEARHRYLKLIVYNQDDPPLQLAGFEVQGIEKDLIFQVQPSRSYTLHYGSPDAKAPQYDIERVKSYLSVESLAPLRVGAQSENLDYRPSGPKRPWTETQPVLFWGVLVLLVAGLGTYIIRLMTKVKTA